MSNLPTKIELKLLAQAEAKATLDARNKLAAREQLLRIQLLLAKRPISNVSR